LNFGFERNYTSAGRTVNLHKIDFEIMKKPILKKICKIVGHILRLSDFFFWQFDILPSLLQIENFFLFEAEIMWKKKWWKSHLLENRWPDGWPVKNGTISILNAFWRLKISLEVKVGQILFLISWCKITGFSCIVESFIMKNQILSVF
jgi:hypothetical protein